MVDVLTQITIQKPLEEVAAYASNPDNAPEWYVNINSAKWVTEPPLQLGSRVAFKARFMGKDLSYTYEVVEYEPNMKLVMRTAEGPFPMETTYTRVADELGQTTMTLRNAGQPSGFSKLLAPFMSMMMKRANNKDLILIKQILESR